MYPAGYIIKLKSSESLDLQAFIGIIDQLVKVFFFQNTLILIVK